MSHQDFADVPVMWKPDERYGQKIKKFKKIIENKYKLKIDNFWEFHKWSIDHIEELWSEIWEFSEVIFSKKFDKVIDLSVPISESPKWFEGAKMNFAENLLRYRDETVALISAGEDKETEFVTYAQMYEEVRLYAAAFRKIGLKKGDVVVCLMSNRKEAVIAMAAVISIGAIWAGALPLLGAKTVFRRFLQVDPKVFISIDRFQQEGKEIDMLSKVKKIADGIPSLVKIVIIASKKESYLKDISEIKNSCFLSEFLDMGREKDGSVPPLTFEQVSFSHPIYISYTSGTTGLPKALTHGFGVLLGAFRDFALHIDTSRGNVWFSISPVGWITWNIACNLHFLGVTVVLFEGVPYFLSPTYFWSMVEEFKISHIWLPASIMDEFRKKGISPTKENLKSMIALMAGGSVVKPEIYDYIYKHGRKDFPFASTFGCTEFLGYCIELETTMPVYKGEIPALGLGSDIYTVDDRGNRLEGVVGELVLAKPMPNLPLGIWKDDDGSIYREKYFKKYPEKFSMGDYATINPVTKGIIIWGRSDDTLKQRGCRFGSSEIYIVVDNFTEVDDCICVSKFLKDREECAVLFLKMKDGCSFNQQLVSQIQKSIKSELTERHIPDVILETKDIPYSINDKKMEVTVKKIINKMPYSSENIRNPESLKNFFDISVLN